MTFILILVVLVFPFIFFLGASPTTQQLLASISFAVAAIFSMIVLFLPKVVAIISLEYVHVKINNPTNLINISNIKIPYFRPFKMTSTQQFATKIGIKSSKIDSESQIMNHENNFISNMLNVERFQLCNKQILQWRGFLLSLQDFGSETNESPENAKLLQSHSFPLPKVHAQHYKLDVIKEDSLNEQQQQQQQQREPNDMEMKLNEEIIELRDYETEELDDLQTHQKSQLLTNNDDYFTPANNNNNNNNENGIIIVK